MKNKKAVMSLKEFETLIFKNEDPWVIQKTFASWTEVERKKLSTTAQKYNFHHGNALLAIVALCPLSALKRMSWYVSEKDVLEQIIIDRQPDWLDDWIEYELAQEFSGHIKFPMLRRWIKMGICKKPETDGYYQMFAEHLSSIEFSPAEKTHTCTPITQRIRAEPELLEDVWKLLQIETTAFNTESWLTRGAPSNHETWPEAFLKLMNEGLLDRAQLLDATVKGLTFDVKQNQLSGIHKLHVQIDPIVKELEALQPDYLILLCHKVGHVVKFALKMLGQLEKHNKLDQEAFLSEAPVIFLQDNKGNAVVTLKLIKKIIARVPKHLVLGLKSIVEALRHPHIDVQNLAVAILDENKEVLTEDLKNEIFNYSNYVAESLKQKVKVLSGEKDNCEHGLMEMCRDREALEKQLSQLPKKQIKALGLNEIFSNDQFELPTISDNILDHQILNTLEPIKPIADLDELITAVSHAIEITENPGETERILDGLSRLCHDRPDDFEERTKALKYRLENIYAEQGLCISSDYGICLAIYDLILTWLSGKSCTTQKDNRVYRQEDVFLPKLAFIRNLKKRVAKQASQPLISAPTHNGGWIDPLIWVNKLIEYEDKDMVFDEMDLSQSFLRLTPDNRSKALKKASKLSSNLCSIVRFSLGGNVRPTYEDRENYHLWISAARTRAPYKDWQELTKIFKLEDKFPDSFHPAQYDWNGYLHTYKDSSWKFPRIDIVVKSTNHGEDINPQTNKALLPTAAINHLPLLRNDRWTIDSSRRWATHWMLYQWPQKPDGVYAIVISRMIDGIEQTDFSVAPSYSMLNGLFQQGRPWQEMGHLLLCMGLNQKAEDAKGLSTDAFIEGIENGCLHLDQMISVLVRMTNGGLVKLNRLGVIFLQVSQVSPLHAWVISIIIQRWLPHVDIKQRNIYKMLETLLEVQCIVKQPLESKAIETLKRFKGTSKASKLASQILNQSDFDETIIDRVKSLVIEFRLQRIEGQT